MMRKNLISLLIFCLVTNLYWGQNKIFPPTPEIASIGKFIDQPMSLSRGLPQISIPIYNVNINEEFSYPISLQYQTGGIRVTEMASNVGLGWNLNNTGMITRTVKDSPDDIPGSGYMYNNENINDVVNISPTNLQYFSETFDVEPDEYTVTANGLNLKFYYDKYNNIFVQAPLSSVKIEPIYNTNQNSAEKGKIISWIITDIKGIKYYFGTNNNVSLNNTKFITLTNSANENNDIPNHITTWYLTKIEDTKSNVINFNYKTKDVYYLYNKTGESFIKNIGNYATGPAVLTDVNTPTKVISYTQSLIAEKTLEKIKYNNTEILFIDATNSRQDLINNKALKEVQVKENGKLLKKIVFNYSYFLSDNSKPYDSYYKFQEDNYRLKLDDIAIYQGTYAIPQKYKFEYNPTKLPSRYSYSQDAWGFYNGKNNSELIPKTNLYPIFNINSEIGTADRSISLNYSKAGTLTKIIYPTGGYTTYDYESNRIGQVADLSNFPYPIFSNTITRNFGFEAEVIQDPVQTIIIDKSEYKKMLTIKDPSALITFNTSIEGCTNQFNNSACQYQIKIKGINNTFLAVISQPQLSLNIPTGEYEVVAKWNTGNNSQIFGFQLTATWDELLNYDERNQEIGGLRIQKVNFYDTDNKHLYSNQYEYTEKATDNKLISSGKIINYPVFFEKPYYVFLPQSIKISSNSIFPLSNLATSSVVYTQVTEKRIGNNTLQNGKIEYGFNFDNRSDFIASSSNNGTLKNKTNFSFNWRNDLLLYKKVYDNLNNPLQLLTNNYSSKNKFTLDNFGVNLESRESRCISDDGGSCGASYLIYEYLLYPLVTDTYSLDKSETIDYFNGKEAKTTVEYFYNNPSHFQLNRQKTTHPDLNITESSYQYAHEKSNQKLINANMIGIPLETTVIKKQNATDAGKLISKTETKYDNPANLFPSSLVSYDVANPTQASTEVTYNQYDSKGNLQQYTTKDGVPTAIIWGYYNTQPIAKIEGATYDQVSSLATAIVTASNLDADNPANEPALITALDNFRKNAALSSSQISTYTYDPLIGVTTITPPSGIREIYKYDAANRLENIKDINGKLLKEFKYNYKP